MEQQRLLNLTKEVSNFSQDPIPELVKVYIEKTILRTLTSGRLIIFVHIQILHSKL